MAAKSRNLRITLAAVLYHATETVTLTVCLRLLLEGSCNLGGAIVSRYRRLHSGSLISARGAPPPRKIAMSKLQRCVPSKSGSDLPLSNIPEKSLGRQSEEPKQLELKDVITFLVSGKEFDRILDAESKKVYVVKFAQRSCRPCKYFRRKFGKLSLNYNPKLVEFVQFHRETDEITDQLFDQYEVTQTPSFGVFFKGNMVNATWGISETRLQRVIDTVIKDLIAEKESLLVRGRTFSNLQGKGEVPFGKGGTTTLEAKRNSDTERIMQTRAPQDPQEVQTVQDSRPGTGIRPGYEPCVIRDIGDGWKLYQFGEA